MKAALALALAFAFALASPAIAQTAPKPIPSAPSRSTLSNDAAAQILAMKANLWDKYRGVIFTVYGPYCTVHGGMNDLKAVGQGSAVVVCKDGYLAPVTAAK